MYIYTITFTYIYIYIHAYKDCGYVELQCGHVGVLAVALAVMVTIVQPIWSASVRPVGRPSTACSVGAAQAVVRGCVQLRCAADIISFSASISACAPPEHYDKIHNFPLPGRSVTTKSMIFLCPAGALQQNQGFFSAPGFAKGEEFASCDQLPCDHLGVWEGKQWQATLTLRQVWLQCGHLGMWKRTAMATYACSAPWFAKSGRIAKCCQLQCGHFGVWIGRTIAV